MLKKLKAPSSDGRGFEPGIGFPELVDRFAAVTNLCRSLAQIVLNSSNPSTQTNSIEGLCVNNDFRVTTTVFSHFKIKRLIGRYGTEAFVGLLKLWAYAASTESQDGSFEGFTSADLAIIADVNDDQFGDNLVSLGLLDADACGYKIHNWRRHNPYCCESRERTESARKAAKKRWGTEKAQQENKSDK